MKFLQILIPTLTIFLFIGCFMSMDAMDDHFGFTIDKELTIDHSGQGTLTTDTLNLWKSSALFMRNRSSVRSLEIRSISCTVTDILGTLPQTLTGTLSIGNTKGGTPKRLASLDKVSIVDMMSNMHSMTMHGEGKAMMMDMMMDSDDMMMYFDCDSSMQDSMHFNMRFNFEMNARCEKMDMMK